MMSIYSRVCRMYTPHHSVHLRYPSITVHQPSLLEEVLGGRDRASEFGDALGGHDRANLESVIVQG